MIDMISTDKLVKAPDTNESRNMWADYCELQCLVADGKKIDQDQLSSIAIKSYDFSEYSARREKNKKEKLTTILTDVYARVKQRNQLLGDKYPFEIDADEQLSLKTDDLSGINRLYLLLLCASNLGYMKAVNGLTSDFEVVSLLYMRKLFPSMNFKLFGSSNTNTCLREGDVINDAKLKDRIVSLSKFISINCHEDLVISIRSDNKGDGGLDLVGVRPMGDERKSIPVIFGQCACSPEQWADKQQSISENHWSKYLRTWETSFQRYIFIPIWYMNSEKQFEDELKINGCVVVDRLRLLNMADDDFITKCITI
ncbi:MAG: hypothetical protein IJ057_03855 [Bacteroidales bacterium]|nr:hypothetical protein [Bacteroidales bacterium]